MTAFISSVSATSHTAFGTAVGAGRTSIPTCFRLRPTCGEGLRTALHLVYMRVPELPFLGIQLLIKVWFDQIFDADQSRVGPITVVDDALANVFIHMRTVVVRLDRLTGSVGVSVVCM